MEQKPVENLFYLLGIKQKIPTDTLRILYLKECWGLDQKTIAKLEGSSQPVVSRMLDYARKAYSKTDIDNLKLLQFSVDELKYVQSLPREIINDSQLIAFVTSILGLTISHPFYAAFGHNDNIKIAALSSLGIMNNHLEKLFGKTQAAVSQAIKRTKERAAELERPLRHDVQSSVFTIEYSKKAPVNKLTLAGGQE